MERRRRRLPRILLNAATTVSLLVLIWSIWARVYYRDSKVKMAGIAGRGVLIDLDGNGNGNCIGLVVMRELPFGGPDETVLRHVEMPGIRYRHVILGARRLSSDAHAFTISYWWLWAGSAALPLVVIAGWCRRHRGDRHKGLCPACGYDLRATPDRCPECGTLPSSPSA